MASLDYRRHYRSMYDALSENDRHRYWIQISHGTREQYIEAERMIGKLADSQQERDWRELWRPQH